MLSNEGSCFIQIPIHIKTLNVVEFNCEITLEFVPWNQLVLNNEDKNSYIDYWTSVFIGMSAKLIINGHLKINTYTEYGQ